MYWTNEAEDKILRTFLGETAQAPSSVFAALFLSNPGETGGGTEITYNGYQRQRIEFSAPYTETENGISVLKIKNLSDVSFPVSPIAAGTVTHFGLMNAQLGGTMLAYVTLDEPISVIADVAPLILSGEWVYSSQGDFTQGYHTKLLNLLRGVSIDGFSPHVALFNGSPESGGAELSGAGYARIPVTFTAPEVQYSGQSVIRNASLLTSPRAEETWGLWTHTVIFTAASGGEAVAYGERTAYNMTRDMAAMIRAGELSVSLN